MLFSAQELLTRSVQLSQGLHDCQMSLAKMEGKWKAAQSRITSLEKEIQMKNTEVFSVTEEVKRMRQNVIQNGRTSCSPAVDADWSSAQTLRQSWRTRL